MQCSAGQPVFLMESEDKGSQLILLWYLRQPNPPVPSCPSSSGYFVFVFVSVFVVVFVFGGTWPGWSQPLSALLSLVLWYLGYLGTDCSTFTTLRFHIPRVGCYAAISHSHPHPIPSHMIWYSYYSYIYCTLLWDFVRQALAWDHNMCRLVKCRKDLRL